MVVLNKKPVDEEQLPDSVSHAVMVRSAEQRGHTQLLITCITLANAAILHNLVWPSIPQWGLIHTCSYTD